ncbi:hypothetical protein V2I21_05405 [Campylobacter sp. CLAX-22107-21]|uniref:hypothetical protein n=1 Tax=Campylobacter devanensis TaxID=3161138 RepID=UPI002E9E5AA6|nr:hypothetical protein [Campylobacter sp. CLAX-22107-21]
MIRIFKWLCLYSILVFIYLEYNHYRYEEYIREKIMQLYDDMNQQWYIGMDNMNGSQETGPDSKAYKFVQDKNEQNSEYQSWLKCKEDLAEAERVQQSGITALYSENQYNLAKDRFDDYIGRYYRANTFEEEGYDIDTIRRIVSTKSVEDVAKRADQLISEGKWIPSDKDDVIEIYNAFHEGVMMNEKKKAAKPIEDLIKFNLERNGNTKGKELNERFINGLRKDSKTAAYSQAILEFLASKDPSGKSSMDSILRSHDYNDLSNFIENMGTIKDYEGLKEYVKLDNNNKALKALGIDVNEFLTNIKSMAEYKSNMLQQLGDGYKYSPNSVELNIGGKDNPYMINTGILANILSIAELDRLKAIAEKDRKIANEMMGIKE